MLILVVAALVFLILLVVIHKTHLRALTEIEKSASTLNSIVENAADGIISINQQGLVESINNAAENIFQYPADEIIGNNIKMLMTDRYSLNHDTYIGDYLRTGVKKVIGKAREVEGLKKDGSIFPLRLAVSETVVDGERIFTGVIQDLSLINKTLSALQASEDKYRHLFNDSWDAIFLVNDNGIIDCNKAVTDVFHATSCDLFLDKNLLDMMPEFQPDGHSSIAMLNAAYASALEFGRSFFEMVCLRFNREEFYGELAFSFIDLDDDPVMQVVIRDISERKGVELQLKNNQENLEAINDELVKANKVSLSMMQDLRAEKNRVARAQGALNYQLKMEQLVSEH